MRVGYFPSSSKCWLHWAKHKMPQLMFMPRLQKAAREEQLKSIPEKSGVLVLI